MAKQTFLNTFLFGVGVVLTATVRAHELPLYVFEQEEKPVVEESEAQPIVETAVQSTDLLQQQTPVALSTTQTTIQPLWQPVEQPVWQQPMAVVTPPVLQSFQPVEVPTTYAMPMEAQPLWMSALPMTVPQPNYTYSESAPAADTFLETGADLIDIEMPFRCATSCTGFQNVTTTLSLKKDDFKLIPVQEGDDLPRFEVNGYTFKNKPLDEALQTLLTEADIAVFTQDRVYPSLSAGDVYGELSAVLDELTMAADTFYQYDAEAKELLLKRKADFIVDLPHNRLVMLGVLDALRGAGVDTVVPDWSTGRMTLTLTRAEAKKVQELLDKMIVDGHLLLADVKVYQTGMADWNTLLKQFGLGRVVSVTDSVNGKLLTIKQKDMQPLLTVLSSGMPMTAVSNGNLIVPNGWKMRFDIGKCGTFAGSNLSLQMQQSLRDIDTVNTSITVKDNNVEISKFKTVTALDNELAIVGLKDTVFGSEWLMTFKLKLIRLVKEQ